VAIAPRLGLKVDACWHVPPPPCGRRTVSKPAAEHLWQAPSDALFCLVT
jgi:hypothetical protein